MCDPQCWMCPLKETPPFKVCDKPFKRFACDKSSKGCVYFFKCMNVSPACMYVYCIQARTCGGQKKGPHPCHWRDGKL